MGHTGGFPVLPVQGAEGTAGWAQVRAQVRAQGWRDTGVAKGTKSVAKGLMAGGQGRTVTGNWDVPSTPSSELVEDVECWTQVWLVDTGTGVTETGTCVVDTGLGVVDTETGMMDTGMGMVAEGQVW